jgi:hypothetical protein
VPRAELEEAKANTDDTEKIKAPNLDQQMQTYFIFLPSVYSVATFLLI